MQSSAATVAAYFVELTGDRRKDLGKLRATIRRALPGACETMRYGMPCFEIDDEQICAFASQKQYMALYICGLSAKDRAAFGKLNCGKGCVRFRHLDDLPLDVVARVLAEKRAAAAKSPSSVLSPRKARRKPPSK